MAITPTWRREGVTKHVIIIIWIVINTVCLRRRSKFFLSRYVRGSVRPYEKPYL